MNLSNSIRASSTSECETRDRGEYFCQHDFCCCFTPDCSGSFQPVAPSVEPFQLISFPPEVVISATPPPRPKEKLFNQQPLTPISCRDSLHHCCYLTSPWDTWSALGGQDRMALFQKVKQQWLDLDGAGLSRPFWLTCSRTICQR